MSKSNVLALIAALPSGNAEPHTLCKVVDVLKAMAAEIGSDGEVDVVSDPSLSKQDLAEQDATVAHQLAPKPPVGHLTYVSPDGTPVPAVATSRSPAGAGGLPSVDLFYSHDGGMTYTTMVSTVAVAASQKNATPGQAFIPGT